MVEHRLEIDAHVVWSSPAKSAGSFESGLAFDDLSHEDSLYLDYLVDKDWA